MSHPAEDTLGIHLGSRSPGDRSPKRGFRRPARTLASTNANLSGLGGRRLALGLSIAALILAAAHFARFLAMLPVYPDRVLPVAAWVVVVLTTCFGFALVRALGARVPEWLFSMLLAYGALGVGFDLAASLFTLRDGVTPTAAAAAGVLLIPLAALRRTRAVLFVALGLSVVLTLPAFFSLDAGLDIVTGLAVAASVAYAAIFAVIIIDGFRRMVRFELDLVLVQSTVGTPRTAVGMHASEDLARLDFDAETLLADVAEGRLPLPLPPDAAETAGSLASQLRMRLIEGRTDTWLRHAVAESEFLTDSVIIDDRGGLAGLFSARQRDALLLAIWLLVGERTRSNATPIRIEIGPRGPKAERSRANMVDFPLFITASGVPHRRIDPATWEAINVVGPHTESRDAGVLRIEVACSVDSPAGSPGIGAAR